MFHFTTLKFWEPENTPPPTVREASDMIGLCFRWADKTSSPEEKEQAKAALVQQVRRWFPEWTGASLARRWGGKKKTTSPSPSPATKHQETPGTLPGFNSTTPAPEPHHEPEPQPEPTTPEPEPQPEPEDEETTTPPAPTDDTQAAIMARVNAGLRNLWLYGPAGTGKTTICKLTAGALGVPYTLLSCSAGTSPCEILGHKFPEPRPSPVSRAVGMPGIIVFDEITMLDASVAAVANSLLANGEIETTTGHVMRHPDCIIIATANTVGDGADRQYIGNNQLDAATLDRFTGGMVKVDYSQEYESRFDSEVVKWVQKARAKCQEMGFRRILSTRAIIAADALKRAGQPWKPAIVETWTDAERRAVGA